MEARELPSTGSGVVGGEDELGGVLGLTDQVRIASQVGITDAPALAAAPARIAMGGTGSDLTVQTADAVVVRDDLTTVPAVIALSSE